MIFFKEIKDFLKLSPSGILVSIDYGLKKTGIAITDKERKNCFALSVCLTKSLLSFLTDLKKTHNFTGFVVGLPFNLEGQLHNHGYDIINFSKLLQKTFNLPIIFQDEQMSTFIAIEEKMAIDEQVSVFDKKSRKVKKNSQDDDYAAAFILKKFLSNTQK